MDIKESIEQFLQIQRIKEIFSEQDIHWHESEYSSGWYFDFSVPDYEKGYFLGAWESWQAAKAQAVPEWICMKDKYPKAGESVLICINGIRQNTTYFYDYLESKEWFDLVFTGDETEGEYIVMVEDVTHWMPLPQEPAND